MQPNGTPNAILGSLAPCLNDRLVKFLLDRCTGKITFNVRDGRILGIHVEEIVTVPGRTM